MKEKKRVNRKPSSLFLETFSPLRPLKTNVSVAVSYI